MCVRDRVHIKANTTLTTVSTPPEVAPKDSALPSFGSYAMYIQIPYKLCSVHIFKVCFASKSLKEN